MNFDRYRESLEKIKKLAENYINLNKSDLARLNTLNEECLTTKEDFVKSFTSLVNEVEDGLTVLIDRFEAIKNDLDRISGPEGTLEDILQLETAWRNAFDLQGNIRMLISPQTLETLAEAGDREAAAGSASSDTSPEKTPGSGIADSAGEIAALARQEAAAGAESPAIEPAQAATPPSQVKAVKKEIHENKPANKSHEENNTKKAQHHKKDQKIQPSGQNTIKSLPVSKIYGEAEKKLMEEINKNIELLKSNKKKG
ncbi:MAG: hypothetical protein ACOY30_10150 [Bacillota bacterium]